MDTATFTLLGGILGFFFGYSFMHIATKGNKFVAITYGIICFGLWAGLAFIIRQ